MNGNDWLILGACALYVIGFVLLLIAAFIELQP